MDNSDIDEKKTKFEVLFNKHYNEMKLDYLNPYKTLHGLDYPFSFSVAVLKSHSLSKIEIEQSLIKALSFFSSVVIINDKIIIDQISYELEYFLEAYVEICNIAYNKNHTKTMLVSSTKSMIKNAGFLDWFYARLLSKISIDQKIKENKYIELLKKMHYIIYNDLESMLQVS